MDSGFVWGLVATIVAVALLFGGVVPAVRTQRAKATIDLQAAEITAYSDALDAQETRFTTALHELEERCREREKAAELRYAKDLGELRGRIDAMTPEFASTLATMLVPLLKDGGVSA